MVGTFKSGPGKSLRAGITLMGAAELFSDRDRAEAWFVARRWPNGIRCPECGVATITKRKSGRLTPQYHCTSCERNFTVKTGTIMHDSKLSLSKWGMAFYLFNTSLKGVSSMKLHRDLGITQKAAWHMAHRIGRRGTTRGADGRAGRGRRDLHRREGREQTRGQEAERGAWAGWQGCCGGSSGPQHG